MDVLPLTLFGAGRVCESYHSGARRRSDYRPVVTSLDDCMFRHPHPRQRQYKPDNQFNCRRDLCRQRRSKIDP